MAKALYQYKLVLDFRSRDYATIIVSSHEKQKIIKQIQDNGPRAKPVIRILDQQNNEIYFPRAEITGYTFVQLGQLPPAKKNDKNE